MSVDTDKADNKFNRFRSLHQRTALFVMPNPWDIGTARLLAATGFEALASTSTGHAFSLGVKDGELSREQVLDHCRTIADATDLPVSADLEKGFGDSPEAVADTILVAAKTGIAGCSIEDYSGDDKNPIFDFQLAVERIQAAAEAKLSLPDDFILTARCENFVCGNTSLDDTIKRLQAFEESGADVLYAPGLSDLESIRTLCNSVTIPVNVVIENNTVDFNLLELAEAGVKRVSLGSGLVIDALSRLVNIAKHIQRDGLVEYAPDALDFFELQNFFGKD
jgi:2-methylisocitrate lyase-like PEP mutase family enzyme